MKCIKNIETQEIKRVKNDFAEKQVSSGKWSFIPKKEWKEKVRNPNNMTTQTENVPVEVVEKKKKKK